MLPVFSQPPAEVRIALTPSMLLCEEATADPGPLVDEQSLAGDPAAGKGGAPEKPYFPGWHAAWRYPVHVLIDLGRARRLTRLFFYIETGGGKVGFAHGKPFAWSAETLVERDGYKSWKAVPMEATTRYLRLTLPQPASVTELVVYGAPDTEPPAPPAPKIAPRPRLSVDQLVGVNAFIDDPLDKMVPVSGVLREYHSWGWDTENPDRKTRFQPSGAAGGNAWFFDDYYAGLTRAGVLVMPAIQGNIAGKPFDDKPAPAASAQDPAGYIDHARHLFQFAARYGRKKHPESALTLADGQPGRSGLGVIGAIEDWNEPDKTWRERAGWFTPFELAAMCSADYDGHRGALGPGVGVKAADSTLPFSIGGLAGIGIDYLRAMKLWADFRRDGSFPADILNVHHYCTDGGEQGFGKTGISPEADNLRGKMEALVRWRDTNLPKCELWLTEFGWDTDPRSPIHAPAVGKLSAHEVQAAWLTREILLLAAAGIDRATMFMLRDVDSKGGGVFETCGLVTQKGEWKPKPSLFWLATLKSRLKGFRFAGDVATGRADVTALRFTNGGRTVIALWCPTSEDKRVAGFRLPLPGARAATVVRFANDSVAGIVEKAALAGGAASIDVTEAPALVFVEK